MWDGTGGGVGGGRVNGGDRSGEVGGCLLTNQALSGGSGSIKHWCGV